jgi:hypothetical protein
MLVQITHLIIKIIKDNLLIFMKVTHMKISNLLILASYALRLCHLPKNPQ